MEGAPKFRVEKETRYGPQLRRTNPEFESIDISGELTGQMRDIEDLIIGANELNKTQEQALRDALGDLVSRDKDVNKEVAAILKKKTS